MSEPAAGTPLDLPALGLGCAPLGGLHAPLSDGAADTILEGAWSAGVRYYDTAPWYGRGLSELRLGRLLRGQIRSDYLLSTKVGRTFHRPKAPGAPHDDHWAGGLDFEARFDYSHDGVMRSYEQSLMRLGVNTVDLLMIHDLEPGEHGSRALFEHHLGDLERSGWRALERLRQSGEVTALGAGINARGMAATLVGRFDLDVVLIAMPYTLLDQSALEADFPLCEARGARVIVGSPYASGILATGSEHPTPMYNYAPATAEVIARTRRIEAVCVEHGVDLRAAALQFPLRHGRVAAVLAGALSAEQAKQNVSLIGEAIPPDFWRALHERDLVREDAP